MSNSPSFQPTPVSGPTAVAYYRLPNIPINAYTLLSNLADAIDTANTKLNGHEGRLNDINTNAGNAVNNVTSNSKGQATDALHSLWGDSQTDLTNAQDQLSAITSAQGMGPGPYDFRSILNENASAIQTGLMALENLQQHQDSSGLVPIANEQLEQWKQDVDTLDGSIMNVNMAVEALVMAISSLNNGFAAVCATGLTSGGILPLFNKNAFAHQAHDNTSWSSSGSADEQNARDSLAKAGITGNEADILIMNAQAEGMSFNDISNLVKKGFSSDTIKTLLKNGEKDLNPEQTRSQTYEALDALGKDLNQHPELKGELEYEYRQLLADYKEASEILSDPQTDSDLTGLAHETIDAIKKRAGGIKAEIAQKFPDVNIQEEPSYVTDNRVPKDSETILSDSNRFDRTNIRVKGATVYREKGTGRYYQRDTLHTGSNAEIEVYNPDGTHLKTITPDGTDKGPAVPGRKLPKQ
jgi:hypothetical protein